MTSSADQRFAGLTALVTGAASGIGAASARGLAAQGARVVVADVNDGAGRAVADEIHGEFVHLDVGDDDAWTALVARLGGGAGIDLAHLNAGILAAPEPEPFLDTSIERFRAMVRVNLDGVVLGVHALAPGMIARGGGAIVATASRAGIEPYGGDPMYAATKHGIVGFVRSVAPQLGRAGVRVHAICPSGVDTPMVSDRQKSHLTDVARPVLDPSEVAAAVANLLARADGGTIQTIAHGEGVHDVPLPRFLGRL